MTGYSNDAGLDARDGYRSELLVAADGKVSLFLERIIGGKAIDEPLPISLPQHNTTPEDIVATRRKHFLLQAMCRYLNSGGKLNQIDGLWNTFERYVANGLKLVIPPGLTVIDVIEETTRQTLYLDNETEVVSIVTEDDWIDRVPLTHLASRVPGMPLEPFNDDHPKLD